MLRRSTLLPLALLMLSSLPFAASGSEAVNALHVAAGRNDVEGLRKLLAGGAKIDARDGSGATALLVATHANQVDTNDVKKGANYWTRDQFAARAPGMDWAAFFDAAGLGGQLQRPVAGLPVAGGH